MVERGNTTALDSVFHALADATRRAILRELAREEKTVGEIAEPYTMSLAAVSKHLDVLERASLIQRERSGSHRIVRLNPKPLESAQRWLTFYEQFWSSKLDRLQQLFETNADAEPERPKSATHRRRKKEK